jgi:hypothetical protein
MVVHNRKKPGEVLAKKIAVNLTDNATEQEGLEFFLLGHHRKVTRFLKDYPNAFEDFRSTGNGKDDEGLRIC